MKYLPLRTIVISVLAIGVAATLQAQPQSNLNLRAPATPLVVHDPYFSIWSDADRLTGGPTRHWTGTRQEIAGIVRIDGKNYRYLGDSEDEVPALERRSEPSLQRVRSSRLEMRRLNCRYASSPRLSPTTWR